MRRNICQPLAPSAKAAEMTGETAKGRSISVINSSRPGKRKRAIAQAAATPKMTFIGTAMSTTMNVSRSARNASGSLTASQ
jgi:hypothetical protein